DAEGTTAATLEADDLDTDSHSDNDNDDRPMPLDFARDDNFPSTWGNDNNNNNNNDGDDNRFPDIHMADAEDTIVQSYEDLCRHYLVISCEVVLVAHLVSNC